MLKLIHYDINELEDPQKAVVKKVHWALRIIAILCVLNLINNIAQAIGGEPGIRILYSVLNILLFPPVALYSFYKGYRGLTFDTANLKMYKITQLVLMILYLVFSIIPSGAFNGWIRVSQLFSDGLIFQGILSLLESFLYLGNVVLMAFTVYLVQNHDNTGTSKGVESSRA